MKLNKYENMEIKDICCEDCLFDELLEKAENLDEYQNLLFFAKRELTDFIIKRFITIDEYSFGVIDFDNCGFDYCDEYMISIDGNKTVWCEPVIRNGEVDIRTCEKYDIAYVYEDDIRQEIIDRLLDDKANVVLFGFEDEEFGLTGRDNNDLICDDSYGFTISNYGEDGCYSSYFFYSTDKDIVQEEYEKLKKRM